MDLAGMYGTKPARSIDLYGCQPTMQRCASNIKCVCVCVVFAVFVVFYLFFSPLSLSLSLTHYLTCLISFFCYVFYAFLTFPCCIRFPFFFFKFKLVLLSLIVVVRSVGRWCCVR